MTHWWHNICGRCGKKVAPQGQPFCTDCDAAPRPQQTSHRPATQASRISRTRGGAMSRYHPGIVCIDCGHQCGWTVYRCRQCACRESRNLQPTNHRKENAMHAPTTTPTLGDIGEEEEVEFEPLEVPTTAPVPEKVPA